LTIRATPEHFFDEVHSQRGAISSVHSSSFAATSTTAYLKAAGDVVDNLNCPAALVPWHLVVNRLIRHRAIRAVAALHTVD